MRRLTLLLGFTLTVTGCSPEPVFEGRPVSYWRAQLKHPDAGARWRAIVALARLGPQAKLTAHELIEPLGDADVSVRFHACVALGMLGPQARVAVPALKKLQEDDPAENVRQAAAAALRQIDQEAAGTQTGER